VVIVAKTGSSEAIRPAKEAVDSAILFGHPQMVDKMRFSGKKGRYSDRPVKYIRIFDPGLIEDGKSATPSYDTLAQIPGHQSALLFDGRIETNERVYFTDRRTPVILFPLS
jgi:hypothetical protein